MWGVGSDGVVTHAGSDGLYVIRSEIGNQCSVLMSCLVCSCREDLRINLAHVFRIFGVDVDFLVYFWNEVSDKLAKQGAMKNISETSYSNLLLSSHEIISILEKNVHKQTERSKFAIPSCSRHLARVIYKLRLNTWNTKYSQK